jgi:carbamoyltransferase
MLVLGLKLTHDGAVAIMDGRRLVGAIEMEKVENRPRHSHCRGMADVEQAVRMFGYEVGDFDIISIDGWSSGIIPGWNDLQVNEYVDNENCERYIECKGFAGFGHDYISYTHVQNHISSAFRTHPDAPEEAYCIVWDGGIGPTVFKVTNYGTVYIGRIHDFVGSVYSIMARYYGPFKDQAYIDATPDQIVMDRMKGGYDVPGKLMAWIANGKPDYGVVHAINKELIDHAMPSRLPQPLAEHGFARALGSYNYGTDADLMLNAHLALQQSLVEGATQLIPKGSHLMFVGGSALNIKWNSALRNTGRFASVWVPPFPNDAGSAIGAAMSVVGPTMGNASWNVFSGPGVNFTMERGTQLGWECRDATPSEVAAILEDNASVVLVMDGRAELGPRALGNRSLISSAVEAGMKDRLNYMKKREGYRPVSPICIEDEAKSWFSPGTPDPYMLFEHVAKNLAVKNCPAIVHTDGTSRLQTIGIDVDTTAAKILRAYHKRTGLPILCNTSANDLGCGFFADTATALAWCQKNDCDHMYSSGLLFTRKV